MKTVLNPRGGMGETLSLLAVGVILGVVIGTSGCARADKAGKPPVLPPARVDWSPAPTNPRQVIVCGDVLQLQERVNTLMTQGWKAVPGTQALNGADRAMLVLEQRPRKPAP